MPRLVVLPLVASIAGCFSSPVRDACTVECGAGGGCPDGYRCGDDLFCHPSDLEAPAACAGADAAPCAAWGTFGDPELLPRVNSASDDWGPAQSVDGLEIFFASWRGQTSEIWVARRRVATDEFDVPERVFAELEAGATDQTPMLSFDGLTLYLATTRPGAEGTDIWTASRDEIGEPFDEPVPLAGVNSPQSDLSPWISPDGLRLYLASTRLGSVDFDVFLARRDETGEDFRSPAPMTELNSDDAERWVRLSADEREAFVSSGRDPRVGALDLLRFTRGDADDSFGAAENVAELNTSGDDVGASLSIDGGTLLLNVDADLSGGALADIWIAQRACETE